MSSSTNKLRNLFELLRPPPGIFLAASHLASSAANDQSLQTMFPERCHSDVELHVWLGGLLHIKP
jgi:hypothetical protein